MSAHANSRPVRAALRSGPNGLPRTRVNEFQRGRLIAAAVDTVHELGYQRMTVAQVLIRARVSRKTFYEIFVDREDCFLAAFDDAVAQGVLLPARHMRVSATGAGGHAPRWAACWLRWMKSPRSRGCACSRPSRPACASANVAPRSSRSSRSSSTAAATSASTARPPAAAHGRRRRRWGRGRAAGAPLAGGRQSLSELLGPLMSMIVLPYRGPRAARSELAKRVQPVERERTPGPPSMAARDPSTG